MLKDLWRKWTQRKVIPLLDKLLAEVVGLEYPELILQHFDNHGVVNSSLFVGYNKTKIFICIHGQAAWVYRHRVIADVRILEDLRRSMLGAMAKPDYHERVRVPQSTLKLLRGETLTLRNIRTGDKSHKTYFKYHDGHLLDLHDKPRTVPIQLKFGWIADVVFNHHLEVLPKEPAWQTVL